MGDLGKTRYSTIQYLECHKMISHSLFIHHIGSARMPNDPVDVHYNVFDDSKLHFMHQIGGKNPMVISRSERTKHRWEWWLWKSKYWPKVQWKLLTNVAEQPKGCRRFWINFEDWIGLPCSKILFQALRTAFCISWESTRWEHLCSALSMVLPMFAKFSFFIRQLGHWVLQEAYPLI